MYYEWLRQDVLDLVPEGGGDVLSLGCGAGRTEAELVAQGRRVVAIEMSSQAAVAARGRGVEVIQARAEDALPELEGERFSVLILSDVLEHIVDAEGVLRSCASLLEPGGTAVISVPNFRNFSVFYHLLMRGRLPEWDAGLFDRTHVRWTTKKLVSDWCEGAGLAVRTVTGNMTRRMRLLHWLGLGVFGDLPYRQILIVAEKI